MNCTGGELKCPHCGGGISVHIETLANPPSVLVSLARDSGVPTSEQYEAIKKLDRSPRKCDRCQGCGKIANDDDGTPWSYWAELEPPANLAVTAGIVKPVTCDKCGGSGKLAA